MTDPLKPKPRRKLRRSGGAGRVVWLVLDRYLVVVSAGICVGIWLIADWVGLPLSEGSKAALTSFVGYALLKQKSDERWRELEIQQSQVHELVESLDRAAPGSPEAIEVRRELVALARRSDGGHDDD